MNNYKDAIVNPMRPTRKEEDCTDDEGGSSKLKDGEEAQAISLDKKQVSGEETSCKGLPTLGKWIEWNSTKDGSLSKGWVREYTDAIENTKGVLVENLNGVYLMVLSQQDTNWSYCNIPGEEEKDKAEWEGLNMKIGGRFCNKCNCVNKKLQICTGCFKVYYCDETCQLDNWNSHKDNCKREKIVLKPDPRYPLPEVAVSVKNRQVRRQNEHHQILKAALNGNFTVKRTPLWNTTLKRREEDLFMEQRNPHSGYLEFGVEYELKVASRSRWTEFEWEGREPMIHSKPEGNPTSCTLFYHMDNYLNDEEFTKGGLHYLAGSYQPIEIFWFMLINFNTYGTVAPYYGPCRCNPKNVKAQMPPERREFRKKWNKIFKRAEADINDVQCMYSASKVGCQNYENCPYKHQVEVKKEKKKTPT